MLWAKRMMLRAWQGAKDGHERQEAALRQQLATVVEALKAARGEVHDIATNYDCDESAHRYKTRCRQCVSAMAVLNIDAALKAVAQAPSERETGKETIG